MTEELNILLQKGYTRLRVNGAVDFIEDILERGEQFEESEILIDRGVISTDEELQFRLADSIQTALYEGLGTCTISVPKKYEKTYSDKFELDGILFEEPTANFFSFNNLLGRVKLVKVLVMYWELIPIWLFQQRFINLRRGNYALERRENGTMAGSFSEKTASNSISLFIVRIKIYLKKRKNYYGLEMNILKD